MSDISVLPHMFPNERFNNNSRAAHSNFGVSSQSQGAISTRVVNVINNIENNCKKPGSLNRAVRRCNWDRLSDQYKDKLDEIIKS